MHSAIYTIRHLFIRPWHVVCPAILFAVVIALLLSFPSQAKIILIISSIITQAIGMTTLLLVLNSNLKELRNTSFIDDLIKYLKEIQPSIINGVGSIQGVQVQTSVGCITDAPPKLVGITEKRLEALEHEIERVRQEGLAHKTAVMQSITSNNNAATTRFESVDVLLGNLKTNLENTVIGDYRLQIFSIVMILLGLMLSIPASLYDML